MDSIREHTAYAADAYAQDGSGDLQRAGGGAESFPSNGVNGIGGSFLRHGEEAPAAGAAGESSSSSLAGEFRRMTETMEQQTGHLVEAVGAMKTLASRAEQDSSSLLAARVSSHTSELRAELDTIKQILLLQAGGEGAASAHYSAASSKVGIKGVIENAATDGKIAVGVTKDNGGGKGVLGSRGLEGVRGPADGQISGAQSGPTTKDVEEVKAQEAADRAAAEAAALAATERRKNTARSALSALLADNTPHAAKDGIAMLRMLVANLVNQPNVPRYRRIASSNDNFKKRLLPLEGYRAMMEAVGFKAKGSLWEWTWHEDRRVHIGPSASSNNKAVLEDIVKAIDAVARPNGPPLSSVSTPASLSSTTDAADPAPAITALVPKATVATAPTTPPGANKAVAATAEDANGGMRSSRFSDAAVAAAVGAAGVGGTIKAADGNATNAGAGAEVVQSRAAGGEAVETLRAKKGITAAAAEVNGIGQGDGDVSHRTVEGSAAEASSTESAAAAVAEPQGAEAGVETASAEEAPPASMAEVAAAIQRGDEPPGIRVVEDRLSADVRSLAVSSQPSPPKPWELVAAKGATHDVAEEITAGAARAANGGGGREFSGTGEGRSRPQHAVAVGP
ncbi:unnamed protein product [Scytosiphon promiscuus]